MIHFQQLSLCIRALWELCRYDLIDRTVGFRGNYNDLKCLDVAVKRTSCSITQEEIAQAIERVCTLYWKPVLCLQHSIVTARLLRRYGRRAEVVIGYRPAPFAGHAWVEVEGTTVSDSRGYQRQLFVLERIGAAGN
jgi:Transglutaminase-like superfamily